ncbi:MAG: hypothetical protein J5I98_08780 [Phaeodactylibacter sp.]|nr:hypothetical protein [Phaeodactylibacter sp.]
MARTILLFTLSAFLSVFTFYQKSEHSLDLGLAVLVGLYFIAAMLLSFRPRASWGAQLQFAGLALLVWLVLFSFSYNLLFWILAPVSGGLGAWLVCRLSRRFLGLSWPALQPIVMTGTAAAVAGVLLMISFRSLPKDIFTIGLKAGIMVGLWQLGVGIYMMRELEELQNGRIG